MLFTNDTANKDTPFEVRFDSGSKIKCFDIDTLEMEKDDVKAKTTLDSIKKFYFTTMFKRDFGYIKKGFKVSPEGFEYMYIGDIMFNQAN